jgi:hypothetical protein
LILKVVDFKSLIVLFGGYPTPILKQRKLCPGNRNEVTHGLSNGNKVKKEKNKITLFMRIKSKKIKLCLDGSAK